MSAPADFDLADNGRTLRFSGSLILARLGDLPQHLDDLEASPDRIDIAPVERMESEPAPLAEAARPVFRTWRPPHQASAWAAA